MNDTLSLGTETATWAIKDFSVTLRQEITRAARLSDCTVAEWLHGYFQKHGLDGQLDPVNLNPVKPNTAPVDDLCRLTEAAARLAETSDRMPRMLRSSLSRALREAANRHAPTTPRQPPRLAYGRNGAVEADGADAAPA